MKKIQVLMMILISALPSANAFAWGRFDGGIHPGRPGVGWARPPVVVHRTYVEHPRGCVGCGAGVAAVAGLVGGVIVGAALANAAPPPPPPQVVMAPPPQVVVAGGMPMGTEVTALPPGCQTMNVNGATYYQCGPTWYQPFFGGNAVYYAVVPAP